jgi:hypothetical protein
LAKRNGYAPRAFKEDEHGDEEEEQEQDEP